MDAFAYQYGVMWLVFLAGCVIGLRTGELSFSGQGAKRLVVLVAGMLFYMGLQGAFTDWSGG